MTRRRLCGGRLVASCVALLIASGCGYTVLKTPPPPPQTSAPVTPSVDLPAFAAQLHGSWRGVSRCIGHTTSLHDTIHAMVFSLDSTWILESLGPRITGTWTLGVVGDKVQVRINAPGSPWKWHGPCSVSLSDSVLALDFSRPWQLDCRLRLRRVH